jgi:hypothetical protein
MTEPLLAVSSWSWHTPYYAGQWSLLDLPRDAAALGLRAVEANDFMLPPPRLSRLRRPLLRALPGAPPELWRYSYSSLEQLRLQATQHETALLAWTINSDFTVPAWQWPAQRIYLARGLAAARRLGVRLLRVNLGGSPQTPASRDGRVVTRLAAFVQQSQAIGGGSAITLENHWGISSDIDRHLRIFDRARARLGAAQQARFGCCFTFDAGGRETTLPHERLWALLRDAGYAGAATIEFVGEGEPASGVAQSVALFHTLAS